MDSFLEVLCPDCVVEEITVSEQMMVVKAHRVRHIAVCPDCGQESGRIHSYYDRKPQDLPIGGCYVRLSLTTRRFRCLNEQCQRRTFAESWGDWLYRYAHKTSRMKDALYHVAQVAGGQGGARLLQQLKMVASGTTLIRLLRAQVIPQITTSVIGIDDWAIRRGRTYGTMIVDLEKREVVDLLPDRTAETVASWLESHPEVEIVARDRSSEYARGITMGAPQAQQVADRWHLLLNMCQMLERYMRQSSRRLKKLPPLLSDDGESVISQRGSFIRTEKDLRASQEVRARRVELYEEIQRRRQAGESILGISKELSLHRETVRTFYYAEQYPDRTRKAQSSMLDEFIPHLEKRWAEGCENARELWREIQALGFKSLFERFINKLKLRFI